MIGSSSDGVPRNISDNPEKPVFLVSLFTGIASAAKALQMEGYTIIGMAFSEIDSSARQVVFAQYKAAIDLGDIEDMQQSRLACILREYSKRVKHCLVEAGSPC